MTLARFMLLGLLCLGHNLASAALISVSSPFGPDTATRDTISNRVWLDLSLTRSLSFNDVTTALAADPQYAGFQVGSSVAVDQLISNSGVLASAPANAFADFQTIVTLFGATVEDVSGDGCVLAFYGLVSDAGGASPDSRAVRGVLNDRSPPDVGGGCGAADTESFNLANAAGGLSWNDALPIQDSSAVLLSGVWLFQEGTAISLPGTLPLMGAALCACALRRRMRQFG